LAFNQALKKIVALNPEQFSGGQVRLPPFNKKENTLPCLWILHNKVLLSIHPRNKTTQLHSTCYSNLASQVP
jgi:transposase